MIVDESHTLRTADRAPDSTNTEAAVAAVKAARAAVLLTGTPSLSRPFDLYRQVCSLLLHPVQASGMRAEPLPLRFLPGPTSFRTQPVLLQLCCGRGNASLAVLVRR